MSDLDPEELVLDVHLDPVMKEGLDRTARVHVRLADPPICKRKDATGNLPFALSEELKEIIALKKAIKRYTGAIKALENVRESLEKIDQDALCDGLPMFVRRDSRRLNNLLDELQCAKGTMQRKCKCYLAKYSEAQQ